MSYMPNKEIDKWMNITERAQAEKDCTHGEPLDGPCINCVLKAQQEEPELFQRRRAYQRAMFNLELEESRKASQDYHRKHRKTWWKKLFGFILLQGD